MREILFSFKIEWAFTYDGLNDMCLLSALNKGLFTVVLTDFRTKEVLKTSVFIFVMVSGLDELIFLIQFHYM